MFAIYRISLFLQKFLLSYSFDEFPISYMLRLLPEHFFLEFFVEFLLGFLTEVFQVSYGISLKIIFLVSHRFSENSPKIEVIFSKLHQEVSFRSSLGISTEVPGCLCIHFSRDICIF